jgi:hypothetical protein
LRKTAVIDPIILSRIDHRVNLRPTLPENTGAYPRSLPGARRKAAKIAPIAAGPRRTDHRNRAEAGPLVLLNAGGGSGACCFGIMPENLEPIMVMTRIGDSKNGRP